MSYQRYHFSHSEKTFRGLSSTRQLGHVEFFVNHLSMQNRWKACEQEIVRTSSSAAYASMQIAQFSFYVSAAIRVTGKESMTYCGSGFSS